MLRYSCTQTFKYLDSVNLKEIRIRSGISRPVMAKALGVSLRSVRGWENEGTHPSDPRLAASYARIVYALEQHLRITQ